MAKGDWARPDGLTIGLGTSMAGPAAAGICWGMGIPGPEAVGGRGANPGGGVLFKCELQAQKKITQI